MINITQPQTYHAGLAGPSKTREIALWQPGNPGTQFRYVPTSEYRPVPNELDNELNGRSTPPSAIIERCPVLRRRAAACLKSGVGVLAFFSDVWDFQVEANGWAHTCRVGYAE
jgi:hypothetical protein